MIAEVQMNSQRPCSELNRLPVMFWIYGGSFTGVAGGPFEGKPFARQGVILVVVSYRLGRAGFFTVTLKLGELRYSGPNARPSTPRLPRPATRPTKAATGAILFSFRVVG